MTTLTRSSTLAVSQRIVVGLVALFMGVGIVFATGLAQDARLHNAAHDTRHASGFPCH